MPDLSEQELANQLTTLEDRVHLLASLERLQAAAPTINFKENTILMFSLLPDNVGELTTKSYESLTSAVRELTIFETDLEGKADVVLVKAVDIPSLTYVYQNYFSNTSDFVNLVKQGVAAFS